MIIEIFKQICKVNSMSIEHFFLGLLLCVVFLFLDVIFGRCFLNLFFMDFCFMCYKLVKVINTLVYSFLYFNIYFLIQIFNFNTELLMLIPIYIF